MTAPRCVGRVHDGFHGFYACGRAATTEHEGKPYCKTHNPAIRAAKDAERDAARQAESAARRKAHARADRIAKAREAVIAAAKAWHEHPGDAQSYALQSAVETLLDAEKP